MIVPASLFASVGGFSSDFKGAGAEDRDFSAKYRSAGFGIHFVPDIVVEHHHSMSLIPFMHQHFKYGAGAVIYHEKQKQRTNSDIKVEPLAFYRELFLFPFRKYQSAYAVPIFFCLLLSQVCNVIGFFWTKFTKKF